MHPEFQHDFTSPPTGDQPEIRFVAIDHEILLKQPFGHPMMRLVVMETPGFMTRSASGTGLATYFGRSHAVLRNMPVRLDETAESGFSLVPQDDRLVRNRFKLSGAGGEWSQSTLVGERYAKQLLVRAVDDFSYEFRPRPERGECTIVATSNMTKLNGHLYDLLRLVTRFYGTPDADSSVLLRIAEYIKLMQDMSGPVMESYRVPTMYVSVLERWRRYFFGLQDQEAGIVLMRRSPDAIDSLKTLAIQLQAAAEHYN
jgi:hypothetical protein